MSALDNLYVLPREILNEEYLYNHNIEIDEELIEFINENYDVLQQLLDEGYDITDILNERTLYTFRQDNNDGFDNLRRTLTDSEKKDFDRIHKHDIRQFEVKNKNLMKMESENRRRSEQGLPPTNLDKIRRLKDLAKEEAKRRYSFNDNSIARNHLYTGKIGINKDVYKAEKQKRKNEFAPLLSARKQQIKERLWSSNKFRNLSKEKQDKLLNKVDKKSFAVTMRAIINHEKEHGNQYNTIKKELGKGCKLGEYRVLTTASNRYGKDVELARSSGISGFRKYGSTPFEYGANLKARNQLTPQQSKELALHQVNPKKYPLKSIKINPDKAEYMATHPPFQLKDNKGRIYDYMKKGLSLYNKIIKRQNMQK